MVYTGGARGGISFTLHSDTKLFPRTVHSTATGTKLIVPTSAAGGAMTMWHSVQLPAVHWSCWWHTIPVVVVNTNTINSTETMTRQIRVGSGIASDPRGTLLLHPQCIYSQPRRCFIEDSSHIRTAPIAMECPR